MGLVREKVFALGGVTGKVIYTFRFGVDCNGNGYYLDRENDLF
jgi:hypothetical protein